MSEVKTVDIKGLLDTYEFPYTIQSSGKELLIRPITTGQMKRVLAFEEETNPYVVEDALDRLISDCVVNEDFNMDDLYLQDRFSLLVEVRKITKGDTYQFSYKCGKCKVDNMATIVLSELNVKPFNPKNNVIEINDNLKFEVDFPTRRDQKNAIQALHGKNLTYRERAIEVQTGTYANSIKKVHTPDGVLEDVSFADKVYILDNVSGEIFERFVSWFKEYDFGIDFEQDVMCTSCGHQSKVDIPLSDFFV